MGRINQSQGCAPLLYPTKAEDTKLERPVALKFLAAQLLEDEEARERFTREAKAAAALDHPNICTIHEIDEADGQTFLAMAYVEGQTVKEKIAQRPLKLDEALDIAIQTSQGLQAAHEKGIVHRDIKSANLMATPQGQVKVMDFGLAQLAERSKLTKTSTVLGTPAYMSPEQAQRQPTNRRTDIWSLAVVIYEMVTGRLPFEGEREQAVLYAIAREEPEPMTAQRVDVPVELDRIVSKAMSKNPEERHQHVDEMLVDLRSLRRSLQVAAHKTPTSRERTRAHPLRDASSRQREPVARHTQVGPRRWRQLLPWSLVVLAVAMALWSWIVSRTYRSATEPVVRTSIILPLDQQPLGSFAISPDGANLVYRVQSDVDTRLYLRALDQFDVRPLPGTELARNPFFSPDSQWVGFSASRMLQKVSITGGAPVRICDLPSDFTSGAYASWGPDDTIIYSPAGAGLLQVPASGGEPAALTTLDIESGERRYSFPQILPNGKDVLFIIRADTGSHIALLSLETKERTVLSGLGEASWAQYLSTGHLVYVRPAGVLAVPFDLERREATGPPHSVLDDADFDSGGSGSPSFTISQSGSLVYASGNATDRDRSLMWVERDGRATLLAEALRGSRHPRLSPDGRRVAEAGSRGSGRFDIWILDVERGTRTPLTHEGNNFVPAWAPDRGRVAFTSIRGGKDWDVFWKAVDGTGEVEALLTEQHTQWPTSWSPDGELLVFAEDNPQTGWDIGILSLQREARRSAFLATKFNEFSAKFSPDGSWLAHVSDESGQDEVYVRPYPGPGPRFLISSDGGQEPVWSPDGRELYYRNGDQVLAVAITTEPAFRPGRPELLFEARYEKSPVPAVNYDISPDGKRFLMVKERPGTTRVHFNVVLNWFEELKRLVPEE